MGICGSAAADKDAIAQLQQEQADKEAAERERNAAEHRAASAQQAPVVARTSSAVAPQADKAGAGSAAGAVAYESDNSPPLTQRASEADVKIKFDKSKEDVAAFLATVPLLSTRLLWPRSVL